MLEEMFLLLLVFQVCQILSFSIVPSHANGFVGPKSMTNGSFLGTAYLMRSSSVLPTSSRRISSTTLAMALQVKIRIVGKKKAGGSDKWLEEAYDMYHTRLRGNQVQVETLWHKSNQDLLQGMAADQSKQASTVILDIARGKTCTSEQFATNVYDWLERGGSRLTFCIGGADGLPPEIFTMASSAATATTTTTAIVSLSSLTLTHQWARTLLMEQLYRASEIRRGSGYHK